MTQALLPWIHLAKQLVLPPQRLRVVLNRLPKQGEKCVAQIWVDDVFVQDISKLANQPGFNQRQRNVIAHLLPTQAYHLRPDGLTLSHEQVGAILPFAQDCILDVQDQGTLTLGTTPAHLCGRLEAQALTFVAQTPEGQVFSNPLLFGKSPCLLVSENLHIHTVIPSLLPEEVASLLSCPPLSLDALQDPSTVTTLEHIASMGVDLSCLLSIATTTAEPTVILRALHSRNTLGESVLRLHIVTEFSHDGKTEEVEIPSRGKLCPVLYWPHAPHTFFVRPSIKEEMAREIVFSLGAKPAHRHRGFQITGPKAITALTNITQHKDLPEWIKIERDNLPSVVSLPLEPTLVISPATRPHEVIAALQLGLEHVPPSLTVASLIAAFQANQTAILADDDTLITFSPETLKAITTLSEVLGLHTISDTVTIPFSEVGLLYSALQNHIQLKAQAEIQKRLENFYPAPIPEDAVLPKGLQTTLRPYQQDAITWLSQLHRAGLGRILADDMGLGKTLMVLTFLAKLKEQEGPMPSLVVAPTSVIDVWASEAMRHLPSLNVHKWHGAGRTELLEEAKKADIIVTSYALLRRDSESILSQIPFRYLILDEAQSVKNSRTESWKSANLIGSQQRLALTGTPIENRVEDLFNIADLIERGILGGEKTFQKRYAIPIAQGNSSRAEELRLRVHPLILRRKKSDVESELPPKIENILTCTMTPSQAALYKTVLQRVGSELHSAIYQEPSHRQRISMLAALTRLRQVCCDPRLLGAATSHEESAKALLLEEVLEECLAEGRRIIVYSQFVKMHPFIHDVLHKLGIQDALWLHGASKDRASIVERFQDPNGPRVIVVSLKAGGTGITLTAADTVIFYDPWWNPAVEDQAADRAHRIGQTKTVHVIKLLCKNSIEEQIFTLSTQKRLAAESVLTTDAQGPRSLTLQEIQRLLAVELERTASDE